MRKDIKMIIVTLLVISFLVPLTTANESKLIDLNNSTNETLIPYNCTTMIHIENCTIITTDSGNCTVISPALNNCTVITQNHGNCTIIYIDNCTITDLSSSNCTLTNPDYSNCTSIAQALNSTAQALNNCTIITADSGNNKSTTLISGNNYSNVAFINKLFPQLEIAFENLKTQIISRLDYK